MHRRDSWLTPNRWEPEKFFFESQFEVWHYTNWGGLQGIVENDVIWATESGALNDPSEVIRATNSLVNMWNSLLPDLRADAPGEEVGQWLERRTHEVALQKYFFVSACTEGDKLSHWRSYAQGQGYAIEFKRDSEYRLLGPESEPRLYRPGFAPTPWWKLVSYGGHDDTVEQHGGFSTEWMGQGRSDGDRREYKLLNRLLDAFNAIRNGRVDDEAELMQELEGQHLAHVCFNKHNGYAEEDEVRLAFLEPPFEGYLHSRQGEFSAETRYLKVTGIDDLGHGYTTRNPNPLPIARVKVGPRFPGDREPEIQRVQELLRENGYFHVPVEASKLPYRG